MITTIHKIIIALSVLLLASICLNVILLSDRNLNLQNLEQSKGRVQILQEESAKSTIRIDSLKSIVTMDTVKTNKTKEGIQYITKFYAIEKNHISQLPLDSGILFLSNRISPKSHH